MHSLVLLLAVPLLSLVPTPAEAAAGQCRAVEATVVGTSGPDRLTGTQGRDVIAGLGGDDVIDARGGEDLVCGGAGDDKIAQPLALGDQNATYGGGGRDVLYLSVNLDDPEGDRTVRIDLGAGTVETDGASGRLDAPEVLHLFGDPAWVFHGTRGPDKVWVRGAGAPLAAWTYGGNDMVSGSLGDDVIDGGNGTDRVRRSPGADDCRSIERGTCAEQQVMSARRVQRCDGQAVTIVGTRRPDRLRGTDGDDVIAALGGDDVVIASQGNDVVCGGPGADRLLGNNGNDRLFGGADRLGDSPSGSFLVGDQLDGGEGDDYVDLGFDAREVAARRPADTLLFDGAPRGVVVDLSGEVGTATGRGDDVIVVAPVTRIMGTRRNDVVIGSSGEEVVVAGVGNDRVEAGAGDDVVYAEPARINNGADTVDAGPGDDRIYSYGGRDHLTGGEGDDLIDALSASYAASVDGGAGDDLVRQVRSTDKGFTSDGGTGHDYLVLYPADDSTGIDRVDLRSDPVTGYEFYRLDGEYAWVFHGTDARDRVWAAGAGPLEAYLHGGDDVARGSGVPDRLDGGPGVDRLVGNGGPDTCVNGERGRC